MAIIVAGLAVYANSLHGPFVFDDPDAITLNTSIRNLSNWRTVLFPAREVPTAGRPLVNLSLAVNYALSGLSVTGYHLWNLAMHLACGLLVLGIVRRTLVWPCFRDQFGTAATTLAGAVALIWVVHPLNSEVVDYVTQRSESMMAACYLLTVYAAIRALSSTRAAGWELVAIASCLCGVACKESIATAPVAVVLYDRIFGFSSVRQAVRARWRLYAGLAASWVLLLVLIRTGPRVHTVGLELGISPWTYLLNQSVMLTRYIRLALWPRSLVTYYGWPMSLTLADVWWHALIVCVLLIFTMVALVRRPAIGFLGAWAFLTLAPTSSLVPIVTEVGAERRMYLPMVGIVTLCVLVSYRLWQSILRLEPAGVHGRNQYRVPLSPTLAWVAFGILVGGLSVGTVSRNREYGSPLGLAQASVDRWPTSQAHHWLGEELVTVGRYDEAIAHFRKALPTAPRAHYSLGLELFREGKWEEAIEEFQAYIRMQPLLALVPLADARMAQAYAKLSRWDEALEHGRQAVAKAPTDEYARGTLADLLYRHRDFEAAIVQYRAYLTLKPNDVNALTNMGVALVAVGGAAEAIAAFRQAVAASPGSVSALQNLSMALLDHGEIDAAVPYARQAVALNPTAAALHTLLGRALARQRHFDEAVREFEQAVALDPNDPEPRAYLQQVPKSR